MNLEKTIHAVVDLAVQQSSRGGGEISQGTFDVAAQQIGEVRVIKDLSKYLHINCEEYFANAAIGIGVLDGMRARLQEMMMADAKGNIPQSEAYALVDLWGRSGGLRGMLLGVAEECERVAQLGVAELHLKARMASVFIMLEEVVTSLVGELSKFGMLGAVGASIDSLMTLIRSQRKGPLGEFLDQYLDELPA